MKKIVVTGASGFIGSHFTKKLLDSGFEVVPLDIRPKKSDTFEVYECDITDYNSVKNFVKGSDYVAHFAGVVDVKSSIKNPRVVWGVNAHGTANLLEAARVSDTKKFLYASTNSVYGAYPYIEGGVDETFPMKPVNPYGASKACGELFVDTYNMTFNLNTASMRLSSVYGPGKRGNVIEIFVSRALEGKNLLITGKNQTRNFTYIDDVIDAAFLLLNSDEQGAFNITGGKRISLGEIAEIVGEYIPGTQIEYASSRKGDAKVQGLLSIDKARKNIDYNPQVDIRAGIGRFIEWYKSDIWSG